MRSVVYIAMFVVTRVRLLVATISLRTPAGPEHWPVSTHLSWSSAALLAVTLGKPGPPKRPASFHSPGMAGRRDATVGPIGG